MLNEFMINLISGFIGAFLILVIQFLYKRFSEINSPFTGDWEDIIYDENGIVIKQDQIRIRQKGDVVYGNIKRFKPENQKHRRWKFSGRIHGKNFIAIFWPKDKSIPSFGCWYVHQHDDFLFKGHYLKLDEKKARKIKKVPVDIKRINQKKNN